MFTHNITQCIYKPREAAACRNKDREHELPLDRKKISLFGDIELNPGLAEIPILLAYGRRFMCSASTYFFNVYVVYTRTWLIWYLVRTRMNFA